jgi:putative redox protein
MTRKNIIFEVLFLNHFLTNEKDNLVLRSDTMKFTIEDEKISGDLGYGKISISLNETNGYRPYELFVSSLVGCSGTLLRKILTKKRFPFQKIDMEVVSIRNPNHSNRIEQLSFKAYVHSNEALRTHQAEKIAQLVVKNCGMIQSVIQSIDIVFTVRFGDYD